MAQLKDLLVNGNARVLGALMSNTLTTTSIVSTAKAVDTNLSRIPSSGEIALTTGFNDGQSSVWLWRENWTSSNYGLFHDNSKDTLFFVGGGASKMSIDLANGDVGIARKATLGGTLIINSSLSGSWDEGIRINQSSNGWTSLTLGGAAGSVSGTGSGIWSLHTYQNNFYLAHNGSSSGTPML
jgi:hypothetical protein